MAGTHPQPEVRAAAVPPAAGRLKRILAKVAARKAPLLAAAAAIGILVAGVTVWQSMQAAPEIDPAAELTAALEMLDRPADAGAWQQARDIATKLRSIGYHYPTFPGAAEFILGIVAFRSAEQAEETSRERDYLRAIRYLRETESRALAIERRPEWCYALGMSLHHVGLTTDAEPYLEEAYQTYLPGRKAAGVKLVQLLADQMTSESHAKALRICGELLASPELTIAQHQDVTLCRAWLFLTSARAEDAKQTLAQLNREEAETPGAVVLHAQLLMADGRFAEARQMLAPVAEGQLPASRPAREASYLMGVCSQAAGAVDAAIEDYQRAVQLHEKTQEGFAAHLRLGELFLHKAWDEQAIDAFRKVLATIRRPEDFRNRWVDVDGVRTVLRNSWNAWVDSGKYGRAIELSRLLSPLIPEAEANELTARASARWAEQSQRELDAESYSHKAALLHETLERWRASGKAYADLADSLRKAAGIREALSTSAEHYRNAHDYQNELDQLTRFAGTQPGMLLPLVYVRQGRALMDLDRHAEALERFNRVLARYPTDPAVFEAQYLAGACRLEQNDVDAAEKTWAEMLESDTLTPAATEWRQALLSLGRLYFQVADMRRFKVQHSTSGDAPGASADADPQLAARWASTARRLEEFVKRYPQSAGAAEARFLLAKSLRQRAEEARRAQDAVQAGNSLAEKNTAASPLLEQARDEFGRLIAELLPLAEQDRLDTLGQTLLRDCRFELAHTCYAMQDYEGAVAAYSAATNHYPHDPQTLLACVQMSNCYDRLQKPAEARGMLEQAGAMLKQMPAEAFNSGAVSRQEWENWLLRAGGLLRLSMSRETAGL